MSTKTGWLKDDNGNKLSPATYTSQLYKDDGTKANLQEQVDGLGVSLASLTEIENLTDSVTWNSSVTNGYAFRYGKMVHLQFRFDNAVTSVVTLCSGLPKAYGNYIGETMHISPTSILTQTGLMCYIRNGSDSLVTNGSRNSAESAYFTITYFTTD